MTREVNTAPSMIRTDTAHANVRAANSLSLARRLLSAAARNDCDEAIGVAIVGATSVMTVREPARY